MKHLWNLVPINNKFYESDLSVNFISHFTNCHFSVNGKNRAQKMDSFDALGNCVDAMDTV